MRIVIIFAILLINCSNDVVCRIQPELKNYLLYADSLSIRYNKHFKYSNIVLKLTHDLSITKHSLGLTTLIENGQRTIQFDYDFWINSDNSVRQVLFLHEFGHAFLKRNHSNGYSIMNTDIADKGWPVCSVIGFEKIECDHTILLNELFLNAN